MQVYAGNNIYCNIKFITGQYNRLQKANIAMIKHVWALRFCQRVCERNKLMLNVHKSNKKLHRQEKSAS